MEHNVNLLRTLIEGNRDRSVSPMDLITCLRELAGSDPGAIMAEAHRQSELFAVAEGWE